MASRKRKHTESGLNGGYWGAAASADSHDSVEDAKYTRRRKASAPKLPFRTRSIFDYASDKKQHKILGRTLIAVHRAPNIYTVDDFLTGSEVDHLVELVAQNKHRFGGSKTDQDDGIGLHATEYRTSRTMHVKKGVDSAIRRIESRAAELVGMQSHNVEGLQIVSYTDGQKFETHHDIGPIDDACEHVVTVVPPRRIITFFVYLNDTPQGVGTTNFPLLKAQQLQQDKEQNAPSDNGIAEGRRSSASKLTCLKVQPKRGRAVLFCNVLANDPSEPDDRVIHCATAVPSGVKKLGVNVWITDSNLAPCAF